MVEHPLPKTSLDTPVGAGRQGQPGPPQIWALKSCTVSAGDIPGLEVKWLFPGDDLSTHVAQLAQ